MAMTLSELRALATRHRTQAEAIGVAALAIVVALALGMSAKRRRASLGPELSRLRAASAEVTSFRTAFATAPAADTQALRLPDSLATSVDRAARVSLAQEIASAAERAGLADVRVRFAAPPDSSSPPPLPQLSSNAPSVADYVLVIECTGRFGAVLSIINHLPPSVAVQRFSAVGEQHGSAKYQLALAVLEPPKVSQHG
jgi:hypothetical protein